MAETRLTGSRIRERRLDLGLRQADLARSVEISPSYLNLIEHNRRRIGGSLLRAIAAELSVEPQALAEGAEAAAVDALRAAAAQVDGPEPELSRAEEFAGRFPGWAALVAAQSRRVTRLEDRVASLNDRLAHDPQLAAALHEVISAATSIRSSASILVSEEEIDADWQRRFHGNIHTDSQRLAQSSEALVRYLDAAEDDRTAPLSPLEDLTAALVEVGFHRPEIEAGEPLADLFGGLGAAGRTLLVGFEETYRADAAAIPLGALLSAMEEGGPFDPGLLAQRFGVPIAQMLRRVAMLPDSPERPEAGLAVCDAAGMVTLMKPIAGFGLPFAGGACPLWPVFSALTAPGVPIRTEVILPGAPAERFVCYAIAGPEGPQSFGAAPRIASTMLVRRAPADATADPVQVGPGCHVCPRDGCPARREPSLLA